MLLNKAFCPDGLQLLIEGRDTGGVGIPPSRDRGISGPRLAMGGSSAGAKQRITSMLVRRLRTVALLPWVAQCPAIRLPNLRRVKSVRGDSRKSLRYILLHERRWGCDLRPHSYR